MELNNLWPVGGSGRPDGRGSPTGQGKKGGDLMKKVKYGLIGLFLGLGVFLCSSLSWAGIQNLDSLSYYYSQTHWEEGPGPGGFFKFVFTEGNYVTPASQGLVVGGTLQLTGSFPYIGTYEIQRISVLEGERKWFIDTPNTIFGSQAEDFGYYWNSPFPTVTVGSGYGGLTNEQLAFLGGLAGLLGGAGFMWGVIQYAV